MITTVSDKEIAQAATIESLRQEITAWSTTAENLEAELERERIRLAACGVVAMADTPDSAIEARKMHPDYESASCDDVKRRVDECIALRAERDALKSDAARWVYWRDYHGFSGYFDEGATASPESADIDAACDAAMKRVQP